MSSRDLERLRELEAAGFALSRNRHFSFFEEPANRRALSLHRYLDALAEEIAQGHAAQTLSATITEAELGPTRLDLVRRDLGVTHTAHLQPDELEALADRGEVRSILALYGVDLPTTGS